MTLETVSGGRVMAKRHCPVCWSRMARFVHRLVFALPADSPLPSHYDVVVCDTCNTAFADSGATADDYAKFYRCFSKYEDPTVASGGGDDPADRHRLDELAAFLSTQVPLRARVLDVGCGSGGLLVALRDLGFHRLMGFDPSETCVLRVRSCGFDADAQIVPICEPHSILEKWGQFDLIILSHVLEHVFDAHDVIASLLPLLSENGLLYIETPDPFGYGTGRFPPFYFFDAEHITHFSPHSFATLACRQGMSLRMVESKVLALSNGALYPAVFCLMQREKALASCSYSGALLPLLQAYVEASLVDLQRLEQRVLEILSPGRPCAIWGAGSWSQRLIAAPWFPRGLLQALVDRDPKKQGRSIAGVVVSAPEAGLHGLPSDTVILVAAAVSGSTIEEDYRALGLSYPLKFLSI